MSVESVALSESGEPRPSTGSVDRLLLNGMAWTAVMRWSAQVVSWVGTAFAARLLGPGDYGLVAMAMLAIGFTRMVEDFGMDAVLVQDRTIDGDRQARLGGLILIAGLTFSLGFIVLAAPIAGFFKEPQVAMIVSVLGLLLITDSIQVIPRALLQRDMQFRRLALLQFIQVLATQSILVAGAYLGWGVWALVFNTLGGAIVVTLVLIAWRPFKVRWPHGLAQLTAPLLQGWRILASRFAWYAYTSADNIVIGRMLGKDALGVYGFASTFSTMVTQEIASVLGRVVPGVFSAVQHLREELRRYFLTLTELLCYLSLPVSIGTALIADLMVELVLGPQWDAVAAPLRILCIYAVFYASQVLVGHLLLWTGRFRANMWCSVLAATLMPAGFYLGARWGGLEGVAWSLVFVFPIVNLPAFVISFRAIGIDGWRWFGAFAPALASCIVMAGTVIALRSVLSNELPLLVYTAGCIAGGAIAYLVALLVFFRARMAAMWEFLKAIRGKDSPAALEPSAAVS
jgi:teichuronic acid exporter